MNVRITPFKTIVSLASAFIVGIFFFFALSWKGQAPENEMYLKTLTGIEAFVVMLILSFLLYSLFQKKK